jgi:CubicO group peptidase (beta-lactamase class C family)
VLLISLTALICIGGPSGLRSSRASASGIAPTVRVAETEPLQAWLDSVRRRHDIPAMGVIVIRHDSILARAFSGARRSTSTAPVEPGDRFQLGSNTKAITATLLAVLVEEGKLSWSSTLGELFPELRPSMRPELRDVSIDLLLSHHAGISAFADTDDRDFRSIPRLQGTAREQRAPFTAWLLRENPAGLVGKGLYSNGGYAVAGAIAERVTGESWETLIQTRIFDKLGLAGSFAWSDLPDLSQPWGHHEKSKGARPVDPRDTDERLPPIIWPGGSVELSLDDYAKFLQLHLEGLEGRDTRLLKSATIEHLHRSPVSPPDKYALGWGLQEFQGAASSVHVGSAGTFYAVTILQPSRDLGVVVVSNAGGARATTASNDAVKALIGRFAAGSSSRPAQIDPAVRPRRVFHPRNGRHGGDATMLAAPIDAHVHVIVGS